MLERQRAARQQKLKAQHAEPDPRSVATFVGMPRDDEARWDYERRLRQSPVTVTQIGVWDGYCNRRSVCRNPHARWWNRGSYSHYCYDCAIMLNQVNRRDAYELLGQGNELCIEMETAEHYPQTGGPARYHIDGE